MDHGLRRNQRGGGRVRTGSHGSTSGGIPLAVAVGVEIDPVHASARHVVEELTRRAVLSKETHDAVIRPAPPLVISQADLDWAIDRLADALNAAA